MVKDTIGILGLPQREINRQFYKMLQEAEAGDASAIQALADKIGDESTANTILKRMKDAETAINGKADTNHTHSYTNLTDKPTIPTVVDTVEDGNSNPVTSNAVYDALSNASGGGFTPFVVTIPFNYNINMTSYLGIKTIQENPSENMYSLLQEDGCQGVFHPYQIVYDGDYGFELYFMDLPLGEIIILEEAEIGGSGSTGAGALVGTITVVANTKNYTISSS